MTTETNLANIYVLQNGINLRECVTTGSEFEINTCSDDYFEYHNRAGNVSCQPDTIGAPVASFEALEPGLSSVDIDGYVKKKVLEEGGGEPLHVGCTVFIAYSSYWENTEEPFDVTEINKPLQVNMKDNKLLPGLQIAIESMLVGELSLFLLSYQLMYGIMGNLPKYKPKAKCVFYIKIVRSFLTPSEGELNLSEPNMFQRVHKEVKGLYRAGVQLFQVKNYSAAIQLFRKAVGMLDRCRLADEKEEEVQQKLLMKLYLNLAICYNRSKLPLKACTACNEINYISNIWHNGKALFQNAKALRMIGEFTSAQKKLTRAMILFPNNEEMMEEQALLTSTKDLYNQSKLVLKNNDCIASDEFKCEINNLIKKFKEDVNVCKLSLPQGMNAAETAYIQDVCKANNLDCNVVQETLALNKFRAM